MMNKKSIIALMVVTLLSGCVSRQNATTGEQETNTATKGALGGAIVGAIAGAATGKKNAAVFTLVIAAGAVSILVVGLVVSIDQL